MNRICDISVSYKEADCIYISMPIYWNRLSDKRHINAVENSVLDFLLGREIGADRLITAEGCSGNHSKNIDEILANTGEFYFNSCSLVSYSEEDYRRMLEDLVIGNDYSTIKMDAYLKFRIDLITPNRLFEGISEMTRLILKNSLTTPKFEKNNFILDLGSDNESFFKITTKKVERRYRILDVDNTRVDLGALMNYYLRPEFLRDYKNYKGVDKCEKFEQGCKGFRSYIEDQDIMENSYKYIEL